MRLCEVEGCSKRYRSRGFCESHYRRWVKHGHPTELPTPTADYGPDLTEDGQSEEWRPIAGHEGAYEVSSFGRVRSLPRVALRRDGKPLTVRGQILQTSPGSRGYPRVTLNLDGVGTWRAVHSLVARAFLPPPKRAMGSRGLDYNVNHIDGSKTNNRVSNLEYITARANISHARATGLLDVRGVNNPRTRLTESDVREIRRLYGKGARQVDLAEQFCIDQTSVSRIILRKSFPEVI